MKAQDLKNSILQLAIQGKLVEQRPEDGTAEELYQKIQAEKQKLIKEGKIKKDKPLPPITEDEIPFSIPSTWKWVKLGDMCYFDTGIFMKDRYLPILDAKYLRGKKESKIVDEGMFVAKGEYLILVDGENSGEVFFVREDGYLGSTFKKLCFQCHNCLFYLLLLLKHYQKFFRDNKKGGAIPHLNKELFKNLLIPLPPLEEQKRIVAKLEELEPLINQYDQAEQELSALNDKFPEQLKKSILQYAIQGKLVAQDENDEPAEVLYAQIQAEKQKLIKEGKIKKEKPLPPITADEIPFDIPKTWKWVRLNDIGNMSRGKSKHRPRNDPRLLGGKYPFIQTGDVARADKYITSFKHTYSEFGLQQSKMFPKNTLCITIAANIADTAILTYEACFPDSVVGFIANDRVCNVEYVYYYFNVIKSELASYAPSTAQKNINIAILNDILVPLPPLAEQKRIVEKIEKIFANSENLII